MDNLELCIFKLTTTLKIRFDVEVLNSKEYYTKTLEGVSKMKDANIFAKMFDTQKEQNFSDISVLFSIIKPAFEKVNWVLVDKEVSNFLNDFNQLNKRYESHDDKNRPAYKAKGE